MNIVEIIFIAIGLPIIAAMAWLVDKKDKYDDLEYFDDDEL
jgi:hypothetical protein